MTKAQAIAELATIGAVCERNEDHHGDTRTGWWLDGVWLAPTNDPRAALAAIRG
jgi:hypothetical protein